MRLALPRLYPITDERLSLLSQEEQAAQLIRAGAALIQIRCKECSALRLYEAVVAVIGFARPLGVKVIVNDRLDVAIAANADGVHIGQEDIPVAEARRVAGPDRLIGLSSHSAAQAAAAHDLPVDYIAIGPVFGTATKKDHQAPVGLDGVRAARALTDKPLVAIGGITLDNGASVISAGADSVAVISDLCASRDITARTAQFIEMLRQVR